MTIIFIRGGAGTGKTTLLSSFIREKGLTKVGWLSLDSSNSGIYSFWHYFVAATGAFLDNDDSFLELLHSNFDTSHLQTLLTLLINRLCSDTDYYLVLDDIHCIRDEELIHSLEFFIRALPTNVHLFMLSREDPPLYLGSLAISARLLFIDGQQMQLSTEEGLAFLKQTLKLSLKEADLLRLNNYAEGWIGGLQLAAAATTVTGRDSALLLRTQGNMAATYLSHEIFEALTPDEKEFLVMTGPLAYFNADICQALFTNFSRNAFDSMIGDLTQKNLFIVCIDELKGIYRYHMILGEYLAQQFTNLPETTQKTLLEKAAEAFERLNDKEEALRLFSLAGNFGQLMRVAKTMGEGTEAWGYLDKVPFDLLLEDADLATQCFIYNFGNLAIDRGNELYQGLKRRYPNTELLHALQFVEVYLSGNRKTLPQGYTMTIQQIESLPLGSVGRAMMLILNAASLLMHMQYEKALDCLEKASGTCANNSFIDMFALNQKAQIYEELGRLDESLVCYDRGMELLKNPSLPSGVGINFYIGFTGVLMRRMELDKAFEALEYSQKIQEKESSPSDIIGMTLDYHFAEMKFLRGDAGNGAAAVNALLAKYPDFEASTIDRLIYELLCADLLSSELADRFLSSLEAEKTYPLHPFLKLIRARIRFGRGNAAEALKETEEVLTFARKHTNQLRLVEAGLLKTFMLLHGGKATDKHREIHGLFREAIYYSYENRILMPYFLDRKTFLPLLQELELPAGKNDELSDAERAFVSDATVLCSGHTKTKDMELLSARELDVLRELALGITNREIADKLYISQATVKTHVLNIFGKLGVSSRMKAVEQGRKKGLLSN